MVERRRSDPSRSEVPGLFGWISGWPEGRISSAPDIVRDLELALMVRRPNCSQLLSPIVKSIGKAFSTRAATPASLADAVVPHMEVWLKDIQAFDQSRRDRLARFGGTPKRANDLSTMTDLDNRDVQDSLKTFKSKLEAKGLTWQCIRSASEGLSVSGSAFDDFLKALDFLLERAVHFALFPIARVQYCSRCWRLVTGGHKRCQMHASDKRAPRAPVSSGTTASSAPASARVLEGRSRSRSFSYRLGIEFVQSCEAFEKRARTTKQRDSWRLSLCGGEHWIWLEANRPMLIRHLLDPEMRRLADIPDICRRLNVDSFSREKSDALTDTFYADFANDHAYVFNMLLRAEAWLVAAQPRLVRGGKRANLVDSKLSSKRLRSQKAC